MMLNKERYKQCILELHSSLCFNEEDDSLFGYLWLLEKLIDETLISGANSVFYDTIKDRDLAARSLYIELQVTAAFIFISENQKKFKLSRT